MTTTVSIPPIKSQGIKTRLVPWIQQIVPKDFSGRWIEPFMGTGVVGFNLSPSEAIMCDTNPYVLSFYQALKNGDITPTSVRNYLLQEGNLLRLNGESYYYEVRERFNSEHAPLDFLFLNRACFNGMIRFNRNGNFNVPFCRKPERFASAYITKIVNQVKSLACTFLLKKFEFCCQDFADTIACATPDDLIYCDPPYIDRYADYYNGWSEEQELRLFECLNHCKCRFILSTWHHNDYRENQYIQTLWNKFEIVTQEHFYHLGGHEENRHPMVEALVTNFHPQLTPLENFDMSNNLLNSTWNDMPLFKTLADN